MQSETPESLARAEEEIPQTRDAPIKKKGEKITRKGGLVHSKTSEIANGNRESLPEVSDRLVLLQAHLT